MSYSGPQLLSDIVFYRTYSATKPSGFKETYDETVDRTMQMHMDKFPKHTDAIVRAFDFVRRKVVLPSMRAIEDSTPILTKDGWKTVGEVNIGDYLYDSNGKETQVKDVIHFENKELFEITFDDNVSITACDEHLWIVKTNDDKKNETGPRVVDTKYIREHLKQGDKRNIHVPNHLPITRTAVSLPVDPYVMGYWLGNGYSSGRSICCDVPDAAFITRKFQECGFESCVSDSSNVWAHHVKGLRSALTPLGVIDHKHVPRVYLSGSTEQLLSFLQGLMDSDGSVATDGRCSFSNTNLDIIEAVEEILSCFGVRFTRISKTSDKPEHKTLHTVLFYTSLPVVSLPRKSQRLRSDVGVRNESRRVKSVVPVSGGDATCFVVDSPDRSFLVGKELVVTHNCMQFAGTPILRENLRQFNCSFLGLDSWKSFADLFYILCCGCGVGYSVQSHWLRHLPPVQKGTPGYFVVPDTREGWADSYLELLQNPEMEFVYGFIRPAGALLSTGGTASGSQALKEAHEKIRRILRHAIGRRLRALEAHDIACHIADSVVVGGVRRAACISMFDPEDEEMRLSKTGNWWEKNPQRARANNSAVIHRGDADFRSKYFDVMMSMFDSKAGEPGVLLTNDNDYGKNPCQPARAYLLTPEGIKKLGDVNIGDTIWSGKRWTKVVNKWSTGIKKVYSYHTRYGSFLGTSNHRIVENGVKVEVQDAKGIDICTGPIPQPLEDYTSCAFKEDRGFLDFDRMVFMLPLEGRLKYLRKYFDHNGSISNNGNVVSLICHKAYGIWMQMFLSGLGVRSTVSDLNGDISGGYIKQRVVITHDKDIFLKIIGKESLSDYCIPDEEFVLEPFVTSPIVQVKEQQEEEVFDLTVDDPEHTYWTGGVLVSNCGEVSLRAVCNLTEINAPACANKFEFLQAVNAAAFIGKLQSTYTNFGYVQDRFKKWAEEELLLGISITGQADAWHLIGDAEILRHGAAEAMRTDAEWAAILDMGLSHRLTTTKPSGSASLLLGSAMTGAVSSGIHSAHAAFYIRSIRLDKTDPVARYLMGVFGVGEACSNSVVEYDAMSPNLVVVRVPVNRCGSVLRNNETAVQLMNRAKHVFNNWIKPAHRQGPNCHNVSLTVNYKEHEKGQIMDWMLSNVDCYDGISFLPYSDSTYVQMPFEEITMLDYAEWKDKFLGKEIDFSKINFANTVDKRYGEAACAGGQCTITSL